ncbi:MAG: hypothetical protein II131_04245, partial [Neisseriaceae bacterium]|nr:hypothetical protein [Neisseriaceae bacterium]
DNKEYTHLARMDYRYLSTETIGGFCGVHIGIFAHTRFFPVWLKEYLPVKMFYPPKKGIMSIIVRILLIFFGIWEILYGIFTIIK